MFLTRTRSFPRRRLHRRRRHCHRRPYLTFQCSQLNKYPVLNHLEQRTQVPKTFIVLGGSSILIFLHLFNALASPVSNLVGWALPAYLSFKAIESPSPHDDIQWLTYWVVFGFFNFLESFAARAVLYYVPWYYAFKTLFIIWLQLPFFRVSPLAMLRSDFFFSGFSRSPVTIKFMTICLRLLSRVHKPFTSASSSQSF